MWGRSLTGTTGTHHWGSNGSLLSRRFGFPVFKARLSGNLNRRAADASDGTCQSSPEKSVPCPLFRLLFARLRGAGVLRCQKTPLVNLGGCGDGPDCQKCSRVNLAVGDMPGLCISLGGLVCSFAGLCTGDAPSFDDDGDRSGSHGVLSGNSAPFLDQWALGEGPPSESTFRWFRFPAIWAPQAGNPNRWGSAPSCWFGSLV